MTIIRTARPRTSMDTGFAAGVDALRVSLDAAERAIGRDAPTISTRGSREWGSIELGLTMEDHPLGWGMLELTFSTNAGSDRLVEKWSSRDPSSKAIRLARDAIEGVVAEGETADDERDEIVAGLAWTLMDEIRCDSLIVERGTPWSAARILTGVLATDTLPGRPVQFHWTVHEARSDGEAAALAGMRLGTVVEAHGQDTRLKPLNRLLRVDDAVEPMTRLRALAAWAEFERARP